MNEKGREDALYLYKTSRDAGKSIIAGANIYIIFMFTDNKKQLISKQISDAKDEYMNICTLNYRFSGIPVLNIPPEMF